MRARPMWRPVHYRMHSSCLDSLRHEIFHQTKAQVKGALAGRARCVHTYICTHNRHTHTQRPQKNTHGVPCRPREEKWTRLQVCGGTAGEWQARAKERKERRKKQEPQCFKAKYPINSRHWMTFQGVSLSKQLVDHHQLSTVTLTSMTFNAVFFPSLLRVTKRVNTLCCCDWCSLTVKTKQHVTFVKTK